MRHENFSERNVVRNIISISHREIKKQHVQLPCDVSCFLFILSVETEGQMNTLDLGSKNGKILSLGIRDFRVLPNYSR